MKPQQQRQARERLGVQQDEWAELIGRSSAHISRRESGVCAPTVIYSQLCELLNGVQDDRVLRECLAEIKRAPKSKRAESTALFAIISVCMRYGLYGLLDQVMGSSSGDRIVDMVDGVISAISQRKNKVNRDAYQRYEQSALIAGQLKMAIQNAIDMED